MEGEINVINVMREAQRHLESRERLRAVHNRIEEREALYWLHRAEDDGEREHIRTLYARALQRHAEREPN